MWQKARAILSNAYDNYYEKYDWFYIGNIYIRGAVRDKCPTPHTGENHHKNHTGRKPPQNHTCAHFLEI